MYQFPDFIPGAPAPIPMPELTAQQRQAFSLEALARKMSELFEDNPSLFSDLMTHLERHAGASSEFSNKQDLLTILMVIYYSLGQESCASKKLAIVKALIDDIQQCTNGFYNRAMLVYQAFYNAQTLDDWLHDIRADLTNIAARQASSDVHTHNKYFELAAISYKVRALVSDDPYLGSVPKTLIFCDLNTMFNTHYQPLAVISKLVTRFESMILEAGLSGLIKAQIYDQAMLDEIIEKMTPFFYHVPLLADAIIHFDERNIPVSVNHTTLKKMVYEELVGRGIIIETSGARPLVLEFLEGTCSHDSMCHLMSHFLPLRSGLFYDFFTYLKDLSDDQKISLLDVAKRRMDDVTFFTLLAMLSGEFTDLEGLIEHYQALIEKNLFSPRKSYFSFGGKDVLLSLYRSKEKYAFVLKLILRFKRYDYLEAVSEEGLNVISRATFYPTTFAYSFPIISQIPSQQFEQLVLQGLGQGGNWLMTGFAGGIFSLSQFQTMCGLVRKEILQEVYQSLFEAQISDDGDEEDSIFQFFIVSVSPEVLTELVRLGLQLGFFEQLMALDFNYGENLLHVAVTQNNLEVVRLLLEHGQAVNCMRENFETPLHLASRLGHLEMVQLLVEYQANIKAQNQLGQTPLHVASHHQQLAVAEYLLNKKASVHVGDRNNVSVLFYAIRSRQLDMVKLLLRYGAPVNCRLEEDDLSPLGYACQENIIDIGQYLIKKGARINQKGPDFASLLHFAANLGHLEFVQLFLKRKAKINLQDPEGKTPLHYAAEKGHAHVVQYLLENKANLSLTDRMKKTPLHFAAMNGHFDCVQKLVEGGAYLNALCKELCTPLHWAIEQMHTRIALYLINNNANFNMRGALQRTALHFAAHMGNLEVIQSLIEHGAPLEDRELDGFVTPLGIAAAQNEVDAVELLLKAGADIHGGPVCAMRTTPLHCAISSESIETAKFLISQGASLTHQTVRGNNALHIAAVFGLVQCAELILEHPVDINARNKLGATALHHAVREKQHEMMTLLLAKGAMTNIKDAHNATPLYCAVQNEDLESVQALLKYGAHVTLRCKKGKTPLDLAQSLNHSELIAILEDAKAKQQGCFTKMPGVFFAAPRQVQSIEALTDEAKKPKSMASAS